MISYPIITVRETSNGSLSRLGRTFACCALIVVAVLPSPCTADDTVFADDFPGYSFSDATTALQGAIDSGAHNVVVRAGMPWIISEPIMIQNVPSSSSLNLIFEPGVVVQAKQGAFQGTGDNLFRIIDSSNITLSGYGATLQMRKQDYQDPNLYTPAEWRHALRIQGGNHVTIEGLAIRDSGGDGIYITGGILPWSQDIHIKDVVSDNHHRQGMSVISVDGLLVENSVFSNTSGTPPEGGIDFEPNGSAERLKNIVVRDSVFDNNGLRGGIIVSTSNLNGTSEPIDILIDNPTITGGQVGLFFPDSGNNGRTGTVRIQGGSVSGTSQAGILALNRPADSGLDIQINDLRLTGTATDPYVFPIMFDVTAPAVVPAGTGGITFANVTVDGDPDKPFLFASQAARDVGVANIHGAFLSDNPDIAYWRLGDNLSNVQITVSLTPEPASLSLIALGGFMMLFRYRSHKNGTATCVYTH